MSFGWSAGDIAAAASLVYRLIQALDSCDGAAGDYREAVSFLHELKRTLDPLQGFTAWNAYPAYGKSIGDQVGHIKAPVEQFLMAVLKFEPSLGAKAPPGHHRHCLRKLQWYIFMSTKVLSLKKTIKSHMRIIDTLMQRLTLDIVWTTQQQLPSNLRTLFQEMIRPELITVLHEHLPPQSPTLLEIRQEIRNAGHASHAVSAPRLLELYEELSTNMNAIKQHVDSSKATQQSIESCLRGDMPKTRRTLLVDADDAQSEIEGPVCSDQITSQPVGRAGLRRARESLREVYYLVFLSLGHFLKNFFIVLSRLIEPRRALTPVLLAKYNILFLDAIGRPPRVLPYEYFRHFKVLGDSYKMNLKTSQDLHGLIEADT